MEYVESTKLIDAPLAWQVAGLHETSSGYGNKLTTNYKIAHNGRFYRVYAMRHGNAGSLYIMAKRQRIYLRECCAV